MKLFDTHFHYYGESSPGEYFRNVLAVAAVPPQSRVGVPERLWLMAAGGDYDLIIVDLPGTVNSRGVLNTIVNMDYVLTPIVPDRIVMQSSLSFSTTVLDYIREMKDIPLKEFFFFWTKKDARASTEVFDAYCAIMHKLELNVLDTIVPETNRYEKELSLLNKSFFRCTLFPPPTKLMKGSGLAELAEELFVKLKLECHGEETGNGK